MKKLVVASLIASSSLFAHTVLMSCYDNGDKTVTCEGGFSNGSDAKGVKFQVVQKGKVIVDAKMNADSEYTFKKPNGKYEAVLDAGPGHKVVIKSEEITE